MVTRTTTLKMATAALAAFAVAAQAFAEDAAKPAAPAPGSTPAAAAAPATAPATTPAPATDATNSGSAWNAEVAPNGAGLMLDPAQTEIVKKISTYFGELDGLKGAFVQVGADKKRMKGKFYLMRPGKFRFDYALPSKQVIVSDGEYLAIQDHDLNNEDRVELDKTPFRLLLRKDVDLIRDAKILEVQSGDDLIVLAMRDKDPDTPGTIKLFFAATPALELKEWQTLDAQGQETAVQISELTKGGDLDKSLFKIQALGGAGLARP